MIARAFLAAFLLLTPTPSKITAPTKSGLPAASAVSPVSRPSAPLKPAAQAPASASAAVANEPAPAHVAIDFAPPPMGPVWLVAGLEGVVADEFRRFRTVDVVKKIEPDRCPDHDPRCLVAQYGAAGVQVVVLGTLGRPDTLEYQVYDTWTGTRAFEGALRLSGIATAGLKREIGEIIRPIVQRGGLLDQRPAPVAPEPSAPVAPAPLEDTVGTSSVPLLFGLAMALVASPVLLVLALVGPGELRRRRTPTSWKWSAVLLMVLLTTIAAWFLDLPSLLVTIASHHWPPLLGVSTAIAVGVLWGVFALAVGCWVFAPIQGLDRIRHDALWPLLQAWMMLVLLRAGALLVLHAPVFAIVRRTCAESRVSGYAMLAWLPAAGLLTHFWLLSLVDNLSVYLDVKLTSWPPTERNHWHATIKRYFRGYVRRGVIALDETLLDRTLFLPSLRDDTSANSPRPSPPLGDVVCYGGGFARPRIAVGQKPLETALGELPDEEEFPERTANPDELPLGLLVPSGTPEVAEARAERWRHALTLAPPRPRGHIPRHLGENATLLGWLLPQAVEKGIPLISDTVEDFGVVKRLLSEHYGAFAVSHDDEVDDTDPRQKDFLFGALLREMGVVARRDVLFATIAQSLEVAAAGRGWLSPVLRLPLTLYERLLASPAAKVADAYVALNGALHHLVQYLWLLHGTDEELLTARANLPRLMQTSRDMIARLDRRPARTGSRDRVAWLALLFYAPLLKPRVRWGRIVAGLAAAAAAAALLVQTVSAAVAYHAVYAARINSRATAITERESR